MTYARNPGTWAAAHTRLLDLGAERLADAIAVTASRLRQCANPMRRDTLPLDRALEADIAAARAGHGTPLFDEYRRRLVAAGALAPDATETALARLTRGLRALVSDPLLDLHAAPAGA